MVLGSFLTRDRNKKAKIEGSAAEKLDEDIHREVLKARNALVEQVAAQQTLSDLEQEVEHEEPTQVAIEGSAPEPAAEEHSLVTSSVAPLQHLQQSLATHDDRAERQQLILQQSGYILQQLLQQWTLFDFNSDGSTPIQDLRRTEMELEKKADELKAATADLHRLKIEEVKAAQAELERLISRLARAKSSNDFMVAADLEYYAIPDARRKLESLSPPKR
jgi:hypothetical protein